jgi:ATP-dependent RNA helicase DeaD
VLGFANLTATFQAAPGIAEIEARYREQILEAAVAAPAPDADEKPFVEELLERLSPEQIATAYLRQQLAARPVPEEISETPVQSFTEKATRGKRFENGVRVDGEAGKPRPPAMEGGVWFTLSLGRKHRADPKWLLPMICKAGDLTKRDVGSIKIMDLETRFEIAGDKAAAFGEKVARASLEKGVRIAPAPGAPHTRSFDKPRYERPEGDKSRRYNPAATEKVVQSVADLPDSAAPPVDKPRKKKAKPEPKPKAKFKPKYQGNPKDKGKPKYKGKAKTDAGDAPRQRPAKGPRPA